MKKKNFSNDLLSKKIIEPFYQKENEGRRRTSFGPQKDPDNQRIDEITFWENLQEYLLNSSLHGLKYIGTVRLSTIERAFFTISFIIVTILSMYFISNVWKKWTETPVIIGLNPIATDLNTIPFPAVTICNMNQARKSIAQQIDNNPLDKSILESFCSSTENLAANVLNTSNAGGRWSYVRSILLKVSQPCKDMLISCNYANVKLNCSEIFQSSLTDDGLCCTFNSVDPTLLLKGLGTSNMFINKNSASKYKPIEWTPETGFSEKPSNITVPRAAAGAGSHMGLSVILDANVDEYYCSSTSSSGFKILLHNPNETPKLANLAFFVSSGEETRVEVRPRLSDAHQHIRTVPVRQRQCIFASEANLSFFRTYSKKNCEMECESKLVQDECGCALYYMPKTQEDTKICSRIDEKCYKKIQLSIEDLRNKNFSCQCLPGCYEISYNQVLSRARLGTGTFLVRDNIFELRDEPYAENNLAVVQIFFVETSFRSFRKEELIGFTEFLSNTGGLLGLFMGFSVISLIEIIYYSSLRPYYASKKFIEQKLTNNYGTELQVISRKKQVLAEPHHFNFVKMNESWSKLNGAHRVETKFKVLKYAKNALTAVKMHVTNIGKIAKQKLQLSNEQPEFPYFE